jgi:hypothetical protein
MVVATCVDKTVVVATLRARDLHGRADWVEKELPALIDTATNSSLLRTLGINVESLPAAPGGQDGDPVAAEPDGKDPS